MVLSRVRQLLDHWSLTAITQRLDKRRLQEELDMQRLYLATRWRQRENCRGEPGAPAAAGDDDAEAVASALASEAAALGPDGTKAVVGADLAGQVLDAARAMHRVAEGGGGGGGGGGGSTAGGHHRPSSSLSSFSAAFAAAHGHALAARPSTIPGAGVGVFVEGAGGPLHSTRRPLPPGTLVALYPGVAYRPLSHRALPGYPQVDAGGAFLMARYDGVILDAAAWGRGAAGVCPAPPRDRAAGGPVAAGPAADAEAALADRCDPRNPLALGHLANHPPSGVPPNVMAAAVDVGRECGSVLAAEPWLRRYLPVCVCGEDAVVAVEEEEEEEGGKPRPPPPPPTTTPLPLLALVATRPLAPGTELLLNYRLSPHLGKPDWYTAVDEDEDARRWA